MVGGCQVSVGDETDTSSQVRDRIVAAMDCDEQLMEIKALSASRTAEETYRQLDDLVKGDCPTHQGLREERFIVGSFHRIGASPEELLRGIDWSSSSSRGLLSAIALAGINGELTSPSPDEVLKQFRLVAHRDFMPFLLAAQLYQQQDDFKSVEREGEAASSFVSGKHPDSFLIARSQLAPIYFLEGRSTEANEMSMDFVRLYGDDAWNCPDMIGIAAMSAIDVGKPHEAKQPMTQP